MKRYALLCILGAVLMAAALCFAFLVAPRIDSMGDVQRIFYFHVPSAWLSYIGFLIAFVSSLCFLFQEKEKFDLVARVGAEVGLFFGYIVIMTGPLWARVSWGVWWKWEPRLTSMAFLVLIFTIYVVLQNVSHEKATKKLSAVLALFGTPSIYFVHSAVNRMQGLHPKNVVSQGLNFEMRLALYSFFFAELCLFWALFALRWNGLKAERAVLQMKKTISKMEDER